MSIYKNNINSNINKYIKINQILEPIDVAERYNHKKDIYLLLINKPKRIL